MKLAFKASLDNGGINLPPFVVYKIVNRASGRLYVGVTSQRLNRRWIAHLSSARRLYRKSYLQLAMHEEGSENFSIQIIEYCLTRCVMVERERYWIEALNAGFPSGYNKAVPVGYAMGWKHSEESKEKIRKAKIGQKPSAETLVKLSIWQKGRKLSEEHRAKLSKAQTGKKHSAERCNNIRMSKLGKKRGPNKATREALANAGAAGVTVTG